MLRISLFCWFFLLAFLTVHSQDTLTSELVFRNSHVIEYSNAAFGGEGWAILKQRIGESRFIVLGENHYSPLLSGFTAGLIKEISSAGYTHFIMETGPASEKVISELYSPDSSLFATQLNTFFSSHLFNGSPPAEFFNMKADVRMLQEIIKHKIIIKGIDKETYGSTFFLLDEIKKYCRTKESKSSFAKLKAKVDTVYKHYLKHDEKFKFFSVLESDPMVTGFLETIRTNNGASADLVTELLKVWRNYGLYETGHYLTQSAERLMIMKSRFGQLYQEALINKKPFKALIKIGNAHSGRGFNNAKLLDIGNTISELAESHNEHSLHIMNMRRYRYNEKGEIMDFLNNGYEVYPHIIGQANKKQWVLIDLIPIRTLLKEGKLKIQSKEEQALVLSHDLVLLTPVDGSYKSSLNFQN